MSSYAQKNNLNGSWEGKLIINPEMALRLVININDSEAGRPVITMDSPDQGAYGIPIKVEYISADSLNIAVAQLALQYSGKLSGDSIKGEFTQGSLHLPLTLKQKIITLNRPQTPQPPYPYMTEDVIFHSSLDHAPLYGTLSTPHSDNEKTPAVLLISGSGLQNRDEEIFDHKPFAVIADYMARNGIASLRYDDRGYDKSTGLMPNPTTKENSLDAIGAINFLKEKGFAKIGIIGHSEGGLIADMIANSDNHVDFIIELGGPAVAGDDILVYQNEFLLKDGGLPDEYITLYIDAMKGIFESQKDDHSTPFDETKHAIFSTENISNPVLAPLARNLKENFYSPAPWLKYFIKYNPLPDLRNISIPVLMIYGEKDTQVPPSINVPVLLENIPGINVKVYPHLNHLMQHCNTGKVKEYAEIEETISPEVLEDIKDFILSIE